MLRKRYLHHSIFQRSKFHAENLKGSKRAGRSNRI